MGSCPPLWAYLAIDAHSDKVESTVFRGAGGESDNTNRRNQFQENLPGVAIRCGQDHPDGYGKVGG